MAYAVGVYEVTAALPDVERYNLASQLRKAATSVPLNIAEGSGCATSVEFAKFLGYAYRSLKEVVTGLEVVPATVSDASARADGGFDRRGHPHSSNDPHAHRSPGEGRALKVEVLGSWSLVLGSCLQPGRQAAAVSRQPDCHFGVDQGLTNNQQPITNNQ
jgi:four helix bundle protein